MYGSAQRLGLWLYRQASRLGLLAGPRAQRVLNRAYFAYKRHLEDPFHHLTLRHPEFFNGGHILDVGANIGYTSAVFAAVLDDDFRVWAFEPAAENFRRLESTVAERGLQDRIMPLHRAVGDRLGPVEVSINETHPGDHQVNEAMVSRRSGARLERVDLTTIDEAVRIHAISPVVFIKVDVQGYELHVCRGMTKTLETNPDAVVVVEYCPDALRQYDAEPHELPQFFSARGYRAFRVARDGRLQPVNVANLSGSVQPGGYVDLLFTRAAPRAGE